MKTTFVSTYAIAGGLRQALPRLRTEIDQASVEVSTGRHADVGLALGNRTARSVSLRYDFATLEAHIDSNGMLQARLQQTQIAVQSLRDGANTFLQALVSVTDPAGAAASLTNSASAALSALVGFGNSTGGGQYLFGGINSGSKPLADYTGAPKLAIDTAFAAKFGLAMPNPQSDPAAAGIQPADMADFLDNQFAALFADPAWTDNWSSASATNLSSQIAPNERIETSVNANETALRKLAMAYSMVAGLAAEMLPAQTLDVVTSKSRELLGSAIVDLTGMQSRMGFAEERASSATKRMATEKDIVSRSISSLEGVDPVEAKVRFDTLSTQMEMSYAMTTKILGLSILKYA